MMTNRRVRIVFEVDEDEDGYPPFGRERLWAFELGDHRYQLDNIPFFARGVSLGDVVTCERSRAGEVLFRSIEQQSTNSTIRVVVFDEGDLTPLRTALRESNCVSELSDKLCMLAVNVPASVDVRALREILERGVAAKKWDYEESAIRV